MMKSKNVLFSAAILLISLSFNAPAQFAAPLASTGEPFWQDRQKGKELPKESPKKDDNRRDDRRDDKPKDDKGKKKPGSDFS